MSKEEMERQQRQQSANQSQTKAPSSCETEFEREINDSLKKKSYTPNTDLTYNQYKSTQNYNSEYSKQEYKDVLESFQKLGGQMFCLPIKETYEQLTDENKLIFGLQDTDWVIPICHAGQNRSTVLNMVLQKLKKQFDAKYEICNPHGAEGGFDPYFLPDKLTDDNYWKEYNYGRLKDPPTDQPQDKKDYDQWLENLYQKAPDQFLNEVFKEVFCEYKKSRVGKIPAEEMGVFLNAGLTKPGGHDFRQLHKDRKTMRDWFDKNLYSLRNGDVNKPLKKRKSRRMIFFCFMRAGPIIMRRLVEVANKIEKDLTGIYAVVIPWGDKIAGVGGTTNIGKARAEGDPEANNTSLTKKAYIETFESYANFLYYIVSSTYPVAKLRQ